MRRVMSLMAVAACLSGVLLTRATGASGFVGCEVPAVTLDAQERAFIEELNGYREEHRLAPLAVANSLNRGAEWMARDLPGNPVFGHADTLGRGPWQRSVDCGYPVAGGENLAAGSQQGTAEAAFALFRSSPAHDANMLFAPYREVGVARVFVEGSKYGWYWAVEFGTQTGSDATATAQRADQSRTVVAAAAAGGQSALTAGGSRAGGLFTRIWR